MSGLVHLGRCPITLGRQVAAHLHAREHPPHLGPQLLDDRGMCRLPVKQRIARVHVGHAQRGQQRIALSARHAQLVLLLGPTAQTTLDLRLLELHLATHIAAPLQAPERPDTQAHAHDQQQNGDPDAHDGRQHGGHGRHTHDRSGPYQGDHRQHCHRLPPGGLDERRRRGGQVRLQLQAGFQLLDLVLQVLESSDAFLECRQGCR